MPSPASQELGTWSAVASWTGEPAVPDRRARGGAAAILSATSSGESNGVEVALESATLRIECGREGFARVREFTRATLRSWSLEHRADDATLVVTELAANAATHAVPWTPAGAADVWLRLVLEDAHLVLSVHDPCDSRAVPAPVSGSDLAEHGRGLCIVDALAEEWGWAPHPPTGKTVWAKLPTLPAPS
ncbi:ATP-binding protein [Streptomyces sp. NPDC014864]|uniref:ATP-binding protein n=1 Tax=Streptomyces sp. NPDC014864 TaxID=3364924 RepID=UPI0036FB3289